MNAPLHLASMRRNQISPHRLLPVRLGVAFDGEQVEFGVGPIRIVVMVSSP
jgi:hypothetical protein